MTKKNPDVREPDATSPRFSRRVWSTLSIAVVASVTAALLTATPAVADTLPVPPDTSPQTVSADPLPTVQIDGVVWSQVVNGNKVYAGGQFANARPAGAAPGTNLVPRTNLLAYDVNTGVLDSTWNPAPNGRVLATDVSPDGTRLYVAGAFTAIGGVARYRLAAFDTATGALITSWAPGTNSTVFDIKATNTTVYIAGEFTNANNTARTRVAALSAATGAILPFNAVLDGGYGARAIEISPDASKVVVGGSFLTTNGSGSPGRGMAALDATTGASMPWAVNSVIRNAGNNSSIYSLSSDGDSVYGSGYDYGGTKDQDDFEGSFRANWSDGAMVWMEDCHGDTYSVYPMGDVVYVAGHAHYCGNIGEFPQLDPWVLRHSLSFSKTPSDRTITPDIWGYRSFTGNPAAKLLHWYPVWATGSATGVGQAAWDITSNDKYLLYGGEFTGLNGVRQQGLVRFAKSDLAPNKQGPTIQGGQFTATALSFRAGEARLSWQANYDPDNAELNYEVFRRDVANPLNSTKLSSTYWKRPIMSYSDKSVVAGSTYEYRIRVSDAFGNATQSDWTSVTIASSGTSTGYNSAVLDDAPTNYWPLNEPAGAGPGYDWASGNDLGFTANGITRGVAGSNLASTTTATQFSGSNAFGATTAAVPGPNTFSVEAWFKTSSTSGGKIVGFGDKNTGTSSSYDRHIYIDGSGRVSFGAYPGETRVVQSGTGLNDNKWHHVVGSLSPAGMALYIDGVRVSVRADTTSAQAYNGYWRVGGDNIGSWPNAGATYLSGTISDVAVYSTPLTSAQIASHWAASGRTAVVPPAPADAYGSAVYQLDPTLYWRLGESSGNKAADAGRDGASGNYTGLVTKGQTGALSGISNTAAKFAPTKNIFGQWSAALVSSARSYINPTVYSVETWFKTTTTTGGKIVGFGSSQTGNSSNSDRHIFMSPNGVVNFGVKGSNPATLATTGTSYNNGQWHHVVAQQSSTGMQLFIDGQLKASNSTTTAQNYTGYWRVGGDTGASGDTYWAGTLDEVAVYGGALSAEQVKQHFDLGTLGFANVPPVAEFSALPNGLSASFDASASTDSDGTLANYAWQFGDGGSAVGVTASHSYASAGTYTVQLTVRDDRGAETTVSHDVTVETPNVLPVANFTTSVDHLSLQVDGSTSTDSDGTISSYSWAFGDGAIASGATATHSYAAAGDYQVSLTVTDNRGGSTVKTSTVTAVAPPVPNVAPVAAFTSSAQELALAFDANTSTDSDGTIASYAWNFGDGATATGVTAAHSYAAAGSYDVTLTVTDDDGASNAVTHTVVAALTPLTTVIASDAFARTAASSWGTADVGGAWTVSGGAAAFSVANGKGLVSLAPSQTRESRLNAVSTTDATVDLTMASDVTSAGGTTSVTVLGRQVGTTNYSARVRLEPTGLVRLYILRDEVVLGGGSYVLPGVTYTAGSELSVRVAVQGTNPTTIAAKVWPKGGTEPEWQLQATDATAALQAAGFVGIRHASSSVSTRPTTVLSYDDFMVSIPFVPPVEPTPNVNPVSAFTSTVTGLGVAVDGSTSTDSDGTIASYAWNFGDGATATGTTASHSYGAAGSYTVTLTVTDDDGGTASSTAGVTVVAPPVNNIIATDGFERSATAAWGTADVGGAWTVLGGAPSFSVASGAGVVALTPSQTREARLASVSSTNATTSVQFSADVASVGGTASVTVIGRQVGTSTYSARVRLEPNGVIRLYLLRDEVALGGGSVVLPNAYNPGDVLNVKLETLGVHTTALSAKTWLEGTAEPAWQLQATDATAALQAAGTVGIKMALSSVSTVPTTTLRFDKLSVTQ